MKTTIGVITVGRSDYGLYLPLLYRLREDPEFDLRIIASGMHLSHEFGMTVHRIEADGFRVDERVESLFSSDSPEAISKSIGLATIGFAQVYAKLRPDLLVVLGDRFDMYPGALAALPFRIPVAHIHGGEVTEGAIDDTLRHSMTKLSHLHFVSTAEYARRVIQLGEEAWRVFVVGAPGLENLVRIRLMDAGELATKTGLRIDPEFILVTFHPVTLEFENAVRETGELLAALEAVNLPVIFTIPNADTSGRTIRSEIENYVRQHDNAQLVDNLGTEAYFSAMSLASAMVGNSSSGIIEAGSFKLPVVNIGSRQSGRIRGANVIDVISSRASIEKGIRQALSSEFRKLAQASTNPYDGGPSSEKMIAVLKRQDLRSRLIPKKFADLSVVPAEVAHGR